MPENVRKGGNRVYFRSFRSNTRVFFSMAKWFYTDLLAAQQGPVDDSTLLDLNRSGELRAKSLVWQEGMESWIPFREIAAKLMSSGGGDEPVEIGVCAHSGQIYPIGEMIPYGEALIGIDKKEAFLQRMMEGATVQIEDATLVREEYVGFWWRSLSSLLDYMIKMIPSWIFMVPYYIAAVYSGVQGANPEATDLEGLTGWSMAMGIAYGFGMLGVLAFSIFYDTWMVGKYQATLGKRIIGAKVVNLDGSRLSYKRAFVRWLAKKPLNYLLVWIPSAVGFGLVIAVISAMNSSDGNPEGFVMAMITGVFVYFGLLALCSGVYWMAAFDPEKRALHDRVASTRVVKK
jgi:uncharacterized RDD family membrane protein YckC